MDNSQSIAKMERVIAKIEQSLTVFHRDVATFQARLDEGRDNARYERLLNQSKATVARTEAFLATQQEYLASLKAEDAGDR